MNLINTGSTPDQIAWRIAKTTFVILIRGDDGKLTLIVDPGLAKPWSTKQRKFADIVAKECDGMVATLEDALKLLMKEYPDFEGTMWERLEQKQKQHDIVKAKRQAAMIEQAIMKAGKDPSILIDPKGGDSLTNSNVPKNDVNPINPAY